jgi:hypothetical protein
MVGQPYQRRGHLMIVHAKAAWGFLRMAFRLAYRTHVYIAILRVPILQA